MDKKSIRNIIGLFLFIIILGCLSTFITKSVIGSKRSELYASSTNHENQTSEAPTESQTSSNIKDTTLGGPMHNMISEEEYLKDIQLIEDQITEVWENVTESNSALSATKYEKGVWEEQLNKIYKLYLDSQTSSNKEKLKQEQSSFEMERERLSIAAAKNASEALDGLSYNREYVRLTKEKTYDYIERYFLED